MNIGEAAKATGISTKMLRYYESMDLLQTRRHAGSGYRHFTDADIRTVHFIRQARSLDFSIDDIRTLLQLSRHQDSSHERVRQIASSHLADLTARILALSAVRDALAILMDQCNGSNQSTCPILDTLEGKRPLASPLHAPAPEPHAKSK
jgi:MerR family copper efflux transcriptional regulator